MTIWMSALRRYGLAAACVVGPLILVFGSDFAVQALIPHDKIGSIAFNYMLRDTESGGIATQDSKLPPTDSAKAEQKVAPDPKMELYARHIAGRFNFAVTNGFMYLLAAASFAFGLVVSYRRGGPWFAVTTAVLSSCASAYIAWGVYARRNARPLVIDKILNAADSNKDLQVLATDWSTAEKVNAIMTINTFLALLGIGFVVGGIVLVSVRPTRVNLTLDDLKARVRVIRVALMLISAILGLYVILSKILVQWPLSLLRDEQALALEKVATALVFYWSVFATLGLVAIFTPAVVAWWLDVEAYRADRPAEPRPAGEAKADDGLEFAPRATITAVIAVLAPLLASPLADALKSMFGALPFR